MVRKTELSERCEYSMRSFSDPNELHRRGLRKQRRKCQTISSTDNFYGIMENKKDVKRLEIAIYGLNLDSNILKTVNQ